MLLFIDGLDKGWNEVSQDRSTLRTKVPFSMQRLNRHDDNEIIRNGTEHPEDYFDKHTKNGKRIVRKLPLKVFQERLIHHFDMHFKRNDMFCPTCGNKINRVY